MYSKLLTVFVILISVSPGFSQIFGPNNPATKSTINPGNNWAGGNRIAASDNNYNSVNSEGLTRGLRGSNYGFNLSIIDQIVGIQLEVERKSRLGDDIAVLNDWEDGHLSKLQDYTLLAGNNRLMVVFVGTENGVGEPVVDDITYGGQSMTRLGGLTLYTSFWGAMECWYMLDDQLSLIPNGDHDVLVTYDPFAASEFFDIISAVLMKNVDQGNPFNSTVTSIYNGGPSSCQFNAPITAGLGGAYLTGIFCGAKPNGASPGSTNDWTISNGFTEGTDRYRAHASFQNSGGSMQTAYKIEPLGGSVNPTFTFDGSPNRRLLFGLGLKKATAIDNVVQLQKLGGPVGSNYANTQDQWPIVDTYATYGGPTDLWGTTWSSFDVNSNQFGSIVKAQVFNGSVDVDHMKITIYTVNILPVELIDFQAKRTSERSVNCEWFTATELNTSHFVIERSFDAVNFETVSTETAVGTSQSVLRYDFTDDSAPQNELYYRLKIVDFDGYFEYSDIRAVTKSEIDELNVYPNPTNDWINVLSSEKNGTITITTSEGRVIDQAEGSAFSENYKYNLSSEPDGVYFIIVNTNKGQEVKRLVKTSK